MGVLQCPRRFFWPVYRLLQHHCLFDFWAGVQYTCCNEHTLHTLKYTLQNTMQLDAKCNTQCNTQWNTQCNIHFSTHYNTQCHTECNNHFNNHWNTTGTFFFSFWIHINSAFITAGTHTDGLFVCLLVGIKPGSPNFFLSFFLGFHQARVCLRVEFLLKTDSGSPTDAEVTLFTLANPGSSLWFNNHWSTPPVSALARSGEPRKMSQSPVSRNSNIERRMGRPKSVVEVIRGVA